jgi:hypothetical protein
MAHPKRRLFDEIRTRAWFAAVSRQSGLTAYKIESLFGDTSKSWQKYKKGQHVPNDGIIKRAESNWPGTKRFLFNGPANLFAAASAKSAEDGFRLFMSVALEPRFHGIMARFQRETGFRGSPKKGLSAFLSWLSEIALSELNLAPLAVSASLVTRRFFDEDDLSRIVVMGAEAFEQQYNIGLLDFVRIHPDLLFTFIDARRGLNLPISRSILALELPGILSDQD